MRHLIVCCDGTWNTPDQEAVSNVRRLHNTLVEDAEQVRYYHPGVGTDGGLANWVLGGITGAGLSYHVMHAYQWLTTTYRPGDHVSLFGFSRGAYTVRSLAGMVSACGLFDPAGLDEPAIWQRVEQVYTAGTGRGRDPTRGGATTCASPSTRRRRNGCRSSSSECGRRSARSASRTTWACSTCWIVGTTTTSTT